MEATIKKQMDAASEWGSILWLIQTQLQSAKPGQIEFKPEDFQRIAEVARVVARKSTRAAKVLRGESVVVAEAEATNET